MIFCLEQQFLTIYGKLRIEHSFSKVLSRRTLDNKSQKSFIIKTNRGGRSENQIFHEHKRTMEIFLNGAELSLNSVKSANSENLLKNFKVRVYCYLSSFLFDNCGFFLFARLSGHCGIRLLFSMAIKEKPLPDDTCHKK